MQWCLAERVLQRPLCGNPMGLFQCSNTERASTSENAVVVFRAWLVSCHDSNSKRRLRAEKVCLFFCLFYEEDPLKIILSTGNWACASVRRQSSVALTKARKYIRDFKTKNWRANWKAKKVAREQYKKRINNMSAHFMVNSCVLTMWLILVKKKHWNIKWRKRTCYFHHFINCCYCRKSQRLHVKEDVKEKRLCMRIHAICKADAKFIYKQQKALCQIHILMCMGLGYLTGLLPPQSIVVITPATPWIKPLWEIALLGQINDIRWTVERGIR